MKITLFILLCIELYAIFRGLFYDFRGLFLTFRGLICPEPPFIFSPDTANWMMLTLQWNFNKIYKKHWMAFLSIKDIYFSGICFSFKRSNMHSYKLIEKVITFFQFQYTKKWADPLSVWSIAKMNSALRNNCTGSHSFHCTTTGK